MPHTITKEAYSFAELSERAKERARDWYRQGNLDYAWYESVYEDAAQCGKILGIDLNTKPVKLMGGGTRYDPCIWFSGFASQGDGACFDGTYAYAKGAAKAIRAHAPEDKELHRIADELQAIQRRYFYRIEARTKHFGCYCHSGCMTVEAWDRDASAYADCAAEDDIRDALRAFADWIYRQLEREYDYLNPDEVVDESIIVNEYEFDDEGRCI